MANKNESSMLALLLDPQETLTVLSPNISQFLTNADNTVNVRLDKLETRKR